jgi:hypothetical protein
MTSSLKFKENEPLRGNIISIKHDILECTHTFEGLEEATEFVVKQQFTGLSGLELWVLGSLAVQFML